MRRPVPEGPVAVAAQRDRFVDFLRVFSLAMVIGGHWLAVLVTWEDGTLRGENGLNVLPEMWPLTWAFQVMPLFFFVGGFANRKSYESVVRRGGGYAAYLTGRLQRLLVPTLVFLATGLTIVTGIHAVGLMEELRPAARVVTLPLWFLGVYLMVVAVAPLMLAAHRRLGDRLVAGMVMAAVAVDWIRFGLGVDFVGQVNYAIVWLVVHQLGFLYADGTLQRWARWLLAAGAVVLVALVAWGPYPASLVGIRGNEIDNMNPPTIAILALTALQVGAALLLRRRLAGWLERPAPWQAVVAFNRRAMSVFLWHLATIPPTIAVIYPLGFPQPEPGSAAFWLLRPVWIGLQIPVLAVLVALFGRFESVRPMARDLHGSDSVGSRTVAGVSAALAGLGVLGYARLGLEPVYSELSKDLSAIDVNSLRSLTALVLAVALLRAAGSGVNAAHRAAWRGSGVLAVLAILGAAGVGLFATSISETILYVVGAAVLAAAAASEPRRRRADARV